MDREAAPLESERTMEDRLSRIKREHVRIASAILTVVGAFYTWRASLLPLGNPIGSGAGGTPLIVGILWTACGAYATIWGRDVAVHNDEVGTWPSGNSGRRLLAIAGMSIGFVVLLPWLGAHVTSFMLMTLVARMCGASWLKSVVASVLFVFAMWVLFVRLLDLSLPSGALFGG